jgi:hypothetical protein
MWKFKVVRQFKNVEIRTFWHLKMWKFEHFDIWKCGNSNILTFEHLDFGKVTVQKLGNSNILRFKLLKFCTMTVENLAFCNLVFGKKRSTLWSLCIGGCCGMPTKKTLDSIKKFLIFLKPRRPALFLLAVEVVLAVVVAPGGRFYESVSAVICWFTQFIKLAQL